MLCRCLLRCLPPWQPALCSFLAAAPRSPLCPGPLQLVGAGLAEPACATVHAPLALLPVPFPRETFMRAKAAALAFNAMVDAVSRDEEHLTTVLAAAAQEDPFTVGLKLPGTLCRAAARCHGQGCQSTLDGRCARYAACGIHVLCAGAGQACTASRGSDSAPAAL